MTSLLEKSAALVAALAVSFTMAGCATRKPLTLDELDAATKVNAEASVRHYPGKSPEEVRKAAHRVLYVLDPPDMKFDVRGDDLLATRLFTAYAVFVVVWGRDWYSVSIKGDQAGTRATFGFASDANTGPFASPIFPSFRPDIPVGAYQNPADFNLFHDRVEYILGMRKEWPICDAAKAGQKEQGRLMALCDTIGIEDRPPDWQ